jgi:hypothetical protein
MRSMFIFEMNYILIGYVNVEVPLLAILRMRSWRIFLSLCDAPRDDLVFWLLG